MNRSNDNTRRYLSAAGVGEGMRVLELGCGNGEVTKELARLVGSQGLVVTLDRNGTMLENVSRSFPENLAEQTVFIQVDVTGSLEPLKPHLRAPFDAIVCRRLLMYLKSPAATLARFAPFITQHGIIVVEEADMSMAPRSTLEAPAQDKAVAWIKEMLAKEDANSAIGLQLPDILGDAGFDVTNIGAEAVIEGQGAQFLLNDLLSLIQHRLIVLSIATEIDIQTTITDIIYEQESIDNVYISAMSFYAYGYKM